MAKKRQNPWVLSCPDWADRLRRGDMPIDVDHLEPLLNQKRAATAEHIYGLLRLPDVPGQPQLKDAGAPWMNTLVRLAAGGLDKDGTQRLNTLGVLIPKKNSKTTNLAALTLTLAMMAPRPRAEILLLGPEQHIADLALNQIIGMVLSDPELREIWHVRDHLKRLEHRKSGVRITVKSMSMEAVTGSRVSICLLDELHLMTGKDAARVLGQVRGGMASIPEAQLIWASTQSDVPPRGVWLDEVNKVRNIRDGKLDVPGYLFCGYEPPPKYATDIVAASDPKLWEMVNPNLGYSVDRDWLIRSFKEAASTGEQETRRWLSQHANVQVSNFELSEDAWSGAEAWGRGAEPGLSLEAVLAKADSGHVIGVDGGGLDDLLAITVLAQDAHGCWWSWSHAFIYGIVLNRRQSIASLLRDFEQQGDLTIMDEEDGLGPVIELIEGIYNRFFDVIVGCDPAGVAAELADELADRGIDRDALVAVRQGFGLRPGYMALERRLRTGKLKHADQPMMNWCVSNAKQDPKSGLITKKVSGIAKIDGLVSLATGAIAMLDQPPPPDIGGMIG